MGSSSPILPVMMETSGEKPIRNAGRIVIELPSNLDVKIYFH